MKKETILCSLLCVISIASSQNIGIKTQQRQLLQNAGPDTLLRDHYSQYDAQTDAQKLHDAVTGIGTDEEVIINIIANRTSAQRQSIIHTYHQMFAQDLTKDLKSDSSGQFRSVVKGLLMEPHVYIARQLNKALTSFISDDHSIAEILCTRDREELLPIMDVYVKEYNKTLITEVDECLDGDQRTFLKQILTERIRDKHGLKSVAVANEQVEIIPNAADYCTIGQNRRLMELLAKEPFEQIRQVSEIHFRLKHKTIEDQLKRWCTDDLLIEDYQAVVKYARDPATYYAEELYNAMIGLGTNDNKVKRILISRSEIDLREIKRRYEMLYNRTLASSIEDETSGFYEKILLKLLNNV